MATAFQDYWGDKQVYDANQLQNLQTILPKPAENAVFNSSILFKTIDDRQYMTDQELRYFIHNNFLSIIANVLDPAVAEKYTAAFMDTRFLDGFIDVLSRVQYFDPDTIVRLNMIIYHYMMFQGRKPEVKQRMLDIGYIINRGRLVILKKYGMSNVLENRLMIARYSDFNLNLCVKRTDLVIITSRELYNLLNIDDFDALDNSVDTLARILVDLYRIEDWVYVLPYIMLDVLPDNDGSQKTQWITEDVETMDSTLHLAILHVLETMIGSSQYLASILESYAEGYRLMNSKRPIRFSFQRISYDYPRIKTVVEELREQKKIYVP